MKKYFTYTIPASGMKARKSRRARAWETACHGLIIQQHPDREEGLYLVHRPSGFIVKMYGERADYEKVAAQFKKFGKIDWMAKRPQQVIEQISKLDDGDVSRFLQILYGGKGTRKPEEFRKNCRERLANWKKNIAEQRKGG